MTHSPKTATYTAVALVGAGLVLVFLAWNGAASLDFTQGQIPYLISGGLTGVILATAGLTLVRVQEARRDAKVLAAKLDEVIEALRRQTVAGAVPATARPLAPGGRRVEPPGAARAAPQAVPPDTEESAADRGEHAGGSEEYVVAGRSSYHLPHCRVVEARTGELRLLEPHQADAQGLQPCRVCRPALENPWAPAGRT